MSDLVSWVVTVRPVELVTLPGYLGRAVHALLLQWLHDADPLLAKRWHEADGPKPFTCSTLIGGRRSGINTRVFTPESDYWFRITTLETEVSEMLFRRLADLPDRVELDGTVFRVTGLTTDSAAHEWAGTSDYRSLAEPYLLARERTPRRIGLEFVSPVTFRQREMNQPIPLPDLVFGSLAERWNAFSPVAVSPEVRAYCQSSVALNSFRLRSRALPTKDGSLQIGALGQAHYVAVRFDRYWMSVLGLLADFAFYSGAGRLTGTGMGQVRRCR